MLGDVAPTEYDLRFSVWGIPVRVHPLFWVLAAYVTWIENRLELVLVGIACVFLSILVHELGHALTARWFGWPPNILLYHFGGLAFYTPTSGHTPQRAILISFAGPGAGFLLYGLVYGIEFSIYHYGDPRILSEAAWWAIYLLKRINLYWGLLNLIPVFPLDGGQISRNLLTLLLPSRGLS